MTEKAKKQTKQKSNPVVTAANVTALKSSFRDPAGYMYRDGGKLYRLVTSVGLPDYTAAKAAGLHDALTKDGLMVAHREVPKLSVDGAFVIAPDEVKAITYPFEWSFSMLKDAALATLAVQKAALAHNMTLKDATAYNIQFSGGRPILIDTLSFEPYTEGEPWVAYGQFCRHFLAPLALMAYTDVRLSQMLRDHLDGIPLDLTAKLLPRRARLRPALLMHLVMHARASNARARDYKKTSAGVRRTQLAAILDSLERTVKSLSPHAGRTEWMDYYTSTNYSDRAAKTKQKLIKQFAGSLKLQTVLDLGGNDGHYSRPFADRGIDVICADVDPNAVEYNYRRVRQDKSRHMLPILINLTNPGGAIGWGNEERTAPHERLQANLVMSLALIHHLSISNNVPFVMVAEYFSRFAPNLIIEFVPKEDSQVQKLLATRRDVFPDYDETHFEAAFAEHFKLVEKAVITGSKRTLYLFKRKSNAQGNRNA